MSIRRRIPRIPRTTAGHPITDTHAVNLIWRRLAGREWSGADDLTYIADVLGETDRVHPGAVDIETEDES